MITHQAIGIAESAKTVDDLGEKGAPLRPIAVVHDDLLPGIAPTGDMVHGPGERNAHRTSHGAGCAAGIMCYYKTRPLTWTCWPATGAI